MHDRIVGARSVIRRVASFPSSIPHASVISALVRAGCTIVRRNKHGITLRGPSGRIGGLPSEHYRKLNRSIVRPFLKRVAIDEPLFLAHL